MAGEIVVKIVFISCVARKREGLHRAGDLYQSQWFKKARRYAELVGDQWYILSAKYGVLSPDQLVHDYEQSLNTMTAKERLLWIHRVHNWICRNMRYDDQIEILAGKRYREPLIEWLEHDGYTVVVPMIGLGIGQQLVWLEEAVKYDAQNDT